MAIMLKKRGQTARQTRLRRSLVMAVACWVCLCVPHLTCLRRERLPVRCTQTGDRQVQTGLRILRPVLHQGLTGEP
jgi:hypothetical protein